MKNLFTLLLLVFLYVTPTLLVAQKTDKKKDTKKKDTKKKPNKNEARELKREMQEYYYDIELFEHTRNEVAVAKKKSDSLNQIVQELRKKETENNEAIQKIHDERAKNQEIIRKLEEEAKIASERKEVPNQGTFFSIQIGAFNQSTISELFNQNTVDLKVENDASGFKKYMLGGYTTYEDASAARKKVLKMGAKGAWIVAYKNGSRVPMTDVRTTPIPEEEIKELERIKKN